MITPIQRFLRLLNPDKEEVRNVYIYATLSGIVSLSLPLGIQAIVNLIQGGQVSTAWIVLVFIVVLGVAITGALQIFQLRITENLQQKIFTRASFEFAYRIPRIRMEALYKHYAPELINRFFDTISVQKGLSKILIDFSTATLQIVFGIILLSLYHPFFILFGLLLVILVVAIFRFTAKRGLETSLQESKHKYKVAHWLEEVARTFSSFKMAGDSDLPLRRADGLNCGYLSARENHFKILIQQYSLMVVFKVVVAAGLLAIGGVLVMQQLMNIGQFVAAEIIILLIISSVEKLIVSLETIYDVLTAFEKIGQVTDLELEQNEGLTLNGTADSKGMSIEIRDVDFTYPGYHKRTLEELNLTIPAGERLQITGGNGSGKTTFLYVIAGLYDVQEGQIKYEGYAKNLIDLDSLRTKMGGAFSNDHLFEGTVFENVSMGKVGITKDQVQVTMDMMRLDDFMHDLPEGLDTKLDPQGLKLPRSVIQKLRLARAVSGNPSLLLLEDPFEHIDRKDKEPIIDYLMDKKHNWTVVVISKDEYLAKKVDRIALMADGKVVEFGDYPKMQKYLNMEEVPDA
jgi:ABC-type bacteriocin/lantibiotic exporter with double-glycine peptidase domain